MKELRILLSVSFGRCKTRLALEIKGYLTVPYVVGIDKFVICEFV